MCDGLVRKSDVTKVIETYFTARIDLCHTAEEAANETIRGIDLIQLIRDMKEMGSKEVTIKNEEYDLSGFCDKLWESAYERGYHDRDSEFDCEGCKYIDLPLYNYPCSDCSRYYSDRYEMKGEADE